MSSGSWRSTTTNKEGDNQNDDEREDNLYGMLVDRTDVKRIRKSADDGEDGLFKVVASVFGDKLDNVFVSKGFFG